MNHLNIHYMSGTGQITGYDNGWREDGDTRSHRAGSAVATLYFAGDIPEIGKAERYKINPVAAKRLLKARTDEDRIKLSAATLVLKSDAEVAFAAAPTIETVGLAIYRELCATDEYVSPPPDRPLKGVLTLDWKGYRQELRDLSKRKSAAAMIEAWPLRPDGLDAAESLRKSIKAAGVI